MTYSSHRKVKKIAVRTLSVGLPPSSALPKMASRRRSRRTQIHVYHAVSDAGAMLHGSLSVCLSACVSASVCLSCLLALSLVSLVSSRSPSSLSLLSLCASLLFLTPLSVTYHGAEREDKNRKGQRPSRNHKRPVQELIINQIAASVTHIPLVVAPAVRPIRRANHPRKTQPKKHIDTIGPVTLPTEPSAFESPHAADLEAKRSGREVPSATKVIAVTLSFSPITQPSSPANKNRQYRNVPQGDKEAWETTVVARGRYRCEYHLPPKCQNMAEESEL
eukprot:CAMPEP_0175811164 /NCGR_PEP_ID=MMETSP0107_2-20121207/3704_1 /TAXON_ID=195067 ORGANISM="Goniomonas pacifica, Strain CCMP1869" /NCGR_SAMPLE_ID=MMETSP0107_2 /ASSEMBLY_ACC=CAM_ASM_000203 /LENGTH=276 /DNA_ID=CAMNT_0017122955 /DNA_START=132 /DNA_END=963 /DNA_ORIENTATION=+